MESNTARDCLTEALDGRFDRLRAERKRCRRAFSEQAVHDLRIAERRLLALVDLLRASLPELRLKNMRAALKDQLDGLDALRDTQVLLADFSEKREKLPELIPLQKYLLKREKKYMQQAEAMVANFKLAQIARQVKAARHDLEALPESLDLASHLLTAVDETYSKINQRMQAVDPAQPATIHRVRVVFKKIRYMLEIVHPLLPEYPGALFEEMHAYQTMMGEIQDLEVMLKCVTDFANKRAGFQPRPVSDHYLLLHQDAIRTYMDGRQALERFWRATPQQAFPWEAAGKEPV